MADVEVAAWLKSLPLAPEYRPTEAEFADPIAYITKIEAEARSYGICKIIPPLPKVPKRTVIANLNRSLLQSQDEALCSGATHGMSPTGIFPCFVDCHSSGLGERSARRTDSTRSMSGTGCLLRSMSGTTTSRSMGGSLQPRARSTLPAHEHTGDHNKAKFNTRRQQLGWSAKRSKGQLQALAQKLVWQSGESYTIEQFEAKARQFAKSRLKTTKELPPLIVETLFWKAAADRPITIEYGNDIPGSAFGEPSQQINLGSGSERHFCGEKRKRDCDPCTEKAKATGFPDEPQPEGSGYEDPKTHEGMDDDSQQQQLTRVSKKPGTKRGASFLRLRSVSKRRRKRAIGDSAVEKEGGAGWKLANSPWNMRVMARAPGSLLKYMPDEVPGVTSPMVYIGMLFSWFAWHVEDHELHSLNYLHTGAPKTWYAVPGDAAPALEEVVRVFGYGNILEPGDAFALLGEKTTVMSPEVLIAAGVPCCRLVQNAGDFVVTFPRAYHLGFSHGFNCGEAANFASPAWLEVAKEAAIRRAAMNYLPMLSHQQLLYLLALSFPSRIPLALAHESRSSRLKDKSRCLGEDLVKTVFVNDVAHNNRLLGLLLDTGVSCCILLGDDADLPPLDTKLSEQEEIPPVSAAIEGQSLSATNAKNFELEKPEDPMNCQNEAFSRNVLLKWGTLPCAACGLLCFPSMAIVEPCSRSAALPDPVHCTISKYDLHWSFPLAGKEGVCAGEDLTGPVSTLPSCIADSSSQMDLDSQNECGSAGNADLDVLQTCEKSPVSEIPDNPQVTDEGAEDHNQTKEDAQKESQSFAQSACTEVTSEICLDNVGYQSTLDYSADSKVEHTAEYISGCGEQLKESTVNFVGEEVCALALSSQVNASLDATHHVHDSNQKESEGRVKDVSTSSNSESHPVVCPAEVEDLSGKLVEKLDPLRLPAVPLPQQDMCQSVLEIADGANLKVDPLNGFDDTGRVSEACDSVVPQTLQIEKRSDPVVTAVNDVILCDIEVTTGGNLELNSSKDCGVTGSEIKACNSMVPETFQIQRKPDTSGTAVKDAMSSLELLAATYLDGSDTDDDDDADADGEESSTVNDNEHCDLHMCPNSSFWSDDEVGCTVDAPWHFEVSFEYTSMLKDEHPLCETDSRIKMLTNELENFVCREVLLQEDDGSYVVREHSLKVGTCQNAGDTQLQGGPTSNSLGLSIPVGPVDLNPGSIEEGQNLLDLPSEDMLASASTDIRSKTHVSDEPTCCDMNFCGQCSEKPSKSTSEPSVSVSTSLPDTFLEDKLHTCREDLDTDLFPGEISDTMKAEHQEEMEVSRTEGNVQRVGDICETSQPQKSIIVDVPKSYSVDENNSSSNCECINLSTPVAVELSTAENRDGLFNCKTSRSSQAQEHVNVHISDGLFNCDTSRPSQAQEHVNAHISNCNNSSEQNCSSKCEAVDLSLPVAVELPAAQACGWPFSSDAPMAQEVLETSSDFLPVNFDEKDNSIIGEALHLGVPSAVESPVTENRDETLSGAATNFQEVPGKSSLDSLHSTLTHQIGDAVCASPQPEFAVGTDLIRGDKQSSVPAAVEVPAEMPLSSDADCSHKCVEESVKSLPPDIVSRPRFLCLEHALEARQLLEPLGGSCMVIICHSGILDMEEHARGFAEDLSVRHVWRSVPYRRASQNEENIISRAITAIEDGQNSKKDWVVHLGMSVRHSPKTRDRFWSDHSQGLYKRLLKSQLHKVTDGPNELKPQCQHVANGSKHGSQHAFAGKLSKHKKISVAGRWCGRVWMNNQVHPVLGGTYRLQASLRPLCPVSSLQLSTSGNPDRTFHVHPCKQASFQKEEPCAEEKHRPEESYAGMSGKDEEIIATSFNSTDKGDRGDELGLHSNAKKLEIKSSLTTEGNSKKRKVLGTSKNAGEPGACLDSFREESLQKKRRELVPHVSDICFESDFQGLSSCACLWSSVPVYQDLEDSGKEFNSMHPNASSGSDLPNVEGANNLAENPVDNCGLDAEMWHDFDAEMPSAVAHATIPLDGTAGGNKDSVTGIEAQGSTSYLGKIRKRDCSVIDGKTPSSGEDANANQGLSLNDITESEFADCNIAEDFGEPLQPFGLHDSEHGLRSKRKKSGKDDVSNKRLKEEHIGKEVISDADCLDHMSQALLLKEEEIDNSCGYLSSGQQSFQSLEPNDFYCEHPPLNICTDSRENKLNAEDPIATFQMSKISVHVGNGESDASSDSAQWKLVGAVHESLPVIDCSGGKSTRRRRKQNGWSKVCNSLSNPPSEMTESSDDDFKQDEDFKYEQKRPVPGFPTFYTGGCEGPSTRLRTRNAGKLVKVDEDEELESDGPAFVTMTTPKKKIKNSQRKAKKTGARDVSDEGGDFVCDVEGCTMSFATKQELSMHKRNTCTFEGCGKRFGSHKYLLQHRRVHLDDRPLKCPWNGCKMTFKWKWACTEHYRVHTGERPYKCPVPGCGRTFRFVSDFSRHKRKTGHAKQ